MDKGKERSRYVCGLSPINNLFIHPFFNAFPLTQTSYKSTSQEQNYRMGCGKNDNDSWSGEKGNQEIALKFYTAESPYKLLSFQYSQKQGVKNLISDDQIIGLIGQLNLQQIQLSSSYEFLKIGISSEIPSLESLRNLCLDHILVTDRFLTISPKNIIQHEEKFSLKFQNIKEMEEALIIYQNGLISHFGSTLTDQMVHKAKISITKINTNFWVTFNLKENYEKNQKFNFGFIEEETSNFEDSVERDFSFKAFEDEEIEDTTLKSAESQLEFELQNINNQEDLLDMGLFLSPKKDSFSEEKLDKKSFKRSRSKSMDYSNLMGSQQLEELNNKLLEEIQEFSM